jgi:hypothetical protein
LNQSSLYIRKRVFLMPFSQFTFRLGRLKGRLKDLSKEKFLK